MTYSKDSLTFTTQSAVVSGKQDSSGSHLAWLALCHCEFGALNDERLKRVFASAGYEANDSTKLEAFEGPKLQTFLRPPFTFNKQA